MSDNLFLKNYLQELGLESRQSDIFLTTYQYGPKPASTIASLCHTERSYCYKVLEEFVAQGLVEQTMIRNTKHYYIVSSDVILQKLQQEQDKVTTLREWYHQAKSSFDLLKKQQSHYIPKIQQFEWVEGIRQRYDDMMQSIQSQDILVVKSTITTIFASQVTKFADLQVMYDEFIHYLEDRHIALQGHIGSWSLIVESMNPLQSLAQMKTIAVGNQSIQLWVIGEITYIWLFRQFPIGIKLRSPDMSDLLQTMMEFMR